MKYFVVIGLSILIVTVSCKKIRKEDSVEPKTEKAASFSIEILDNEALGVIAPNATINVLASGFIWTEGPLWIDDGKYLLFSDIPNNKVYKLDSKNDTITYLQPSGFTAKGFSGDEPGSNGLLLNPEGKLVLMQHGDRQIGLMDAPLSAPSEKYISLASSFKGKKFNSPNDGSFDKEGNLYFTDPPYGLPKKMNDPNKQLEFQGVYCLLKNGEIMLLDKLSRPNGIALSLNQKTLYVAVSDKKHAVWYQYDILEPGKVVNKRIFHDVTYLVGQKGQQGLPDGMKVNNKGYLFATGPGGIWIFNKSAKPIGRIYTGQLTSNCALSKDQKTLFITADDYIMSVNLK
ncbi:SMP-30/gluconolactonase/LRE family protein [Maribacter sp. HTCC2170]|uniref:SMP-30/gluconolactonase/LRE family protein n=1 Tax=Maribacter sp. (strain HTCC2170 / KCCM 42371) TaxID=313603 RepID=UPI00006BD2AE|nr:SMP-30/gluconolactonase/LRE family protein [Maribacter sp. HTCC2170]EAR02028.1 gluconolactonase (precursor) [Maribacter sp. HTCC2170]